jgi:hypothetical protein
MDTSSLPYVRAGSINFNVRGVFIGNINEGMTRFPDGNLFRQQIMCGLRRFTNLLTTIDLVPGWVEEFIIFIKE